MSPASQITSPQNWLNDFLKKELLTTDGEKTSVRYKVRLNLLNVRKFTLVIQSGNPIVFSSFDIRCFCWFPSAILELIQVSTSIVQHGVSIQISISLGKIFLRMSRLRNIPLTWILARVFVYVPPFISQILDLICWTVLIFILIYFEWRDAENQQLT